jgi:hypothetical protein
MHLRPLRLSVTALAFVWVLQGPAIAGTSGWRTVAALVASIKMPSTLEAKEREDRAYQVADLIQRKAGKAAPANLVTDLADLMSDEDQVIRFWTAGALGNLGPQSAAAIPSLEKAFKEARAADPTGGGRAFISTTPFNTQSTRSAGRGDDT